MRCWVLALLVFASVAVIGHAEEDAKKKHHHRRHHHKHHQTKATQADASRKAVQKAKATSMTKTEHAKNAPPPSANGDRPHLQTVSMKSTKGAAHLSSEEQIVSRMESLEKELASKEKSAHLPDAQGQLEVNGPLPMDFSERFAQGVAKATGSLPGSVRVVSSKRVEGAPGDIEEVHFLASPDVVRAVEDQAADPDSPLASGNLRVYLVAKDGDSGTGAAAMEAASDARAEVQSAQDEPCDDKDIDIDTEMPYGELEPFGREDTAQELTEQSVKESDEMVDQLERAEVAEEKRAVFRALTRLRGAAITSFDGIARSQTGNIDEYNKIHKWRRTHPLHHLADEESDISKWAFPDNADF
jgi:hypothetical protein